MIRLKDKPLTRKIVSAPNDIGLIEAIRAAGKGSVLFKGHDFHRLPVEMIQIKQNVAYMDHGRVIRAVAGSYIAAYRRNDAHKPGVYFIAVLPQKNALELLEKAKNAPKPQQSLDSLLHKLPTAIVGNDVALKLKNSPKVDVLFDEEKHTPIRQVLYFKKDVVFNVQNLSYPNKVEKMEVCAGQSCAFERIEGGKAYRLCTILPEDVHNVLAFSRYLRRAANEKKILPFIRLRKQVDVQKIVGEHTK